MKVVILCGGRGTRAYPFTEHLPKPMLPVNGQPIVMHLMRLFAKQGIKDFILSLGYREEVIRDYFDLKMLDWNVELVSTGVDTDTGGRISKCRHLVGETFMATYADGLANISLHGLQEFHRRHGGLATVTTVPLVSQYGLLDLGPKGEVSAFREKPTLRDYWINAGFFMFSRSVFDHWEGDNLERDVLPALARKGLIYGYRNDGFFKSMDTFKDQLDLEEILRSGRLD
jgi:glucose-1-phosphate cytidylyltransferase